MVQPNKDQTKGDDMGGQIRKFEKCPACGSKRRMAEMLFKNAAEAQLMTGATHGVLHKWQIIPIDERAKMTLPVGAKVDTAMLYVDACEDCGCVYIVEKHMGVIQKKVRIEKAQQPNRLILPNDSKN